MLSLTEPEVDSLPEAMQVPAKGGIRFDSLQLTFGQDVLLRQDLATIFLIRDNIGKRPIFFSWSDGGYPDQTLGLSPYLVSMGFVRKVLPKPVVANDSIVLSPGLGYLDLPRTKRLLSEVYHWQTAARDRPSRLGRSTVRLHPAVVRRRVRGVRPRLRGGKGYGAGQAGRFSGEKGYGRAERRNRLLTPAGGDRC